VRVVTTDERRSAGAARNAGVATARAPYVAFLAGDSIALPGWAAGRLARHRAGAVAVASAVVAADTRAPALAAHLLRHSARMPHLAAPDRFSRFGVSYERALLDRFGPFPSALPAAEDTTVNGRILTAGVEIAWAPDVREVTRYPSGVLPLIREQYGRGRLRGALAGRPPWRAVAALQALAEVPVALARAARAPASVPPGALVRAVPVVLAGALAGAVGAARGAALPAGAPLDHANLRRRERLARVRRALGSPRT
jgi:hypothetical protein